MEPVMPDIALSLTDILASLSYALDLTGGQPMGHAQRTCLIGLRLGKELGLKQNHLAPLYHALLMKDAGCSSNAARMAEIFGSDDIASKRMSKISDWSNLLEAVQFVAVNTLPHNSLLSRVGRVIRIISNKKETTDAFMQARCDRGAQIALDIGLGEEAAQCIHHLDEHWDGKGGPTHCEGDAIPILGRIACLSQTLEVFARTFDIKTAYNVIRKRSGKWFDPELVRIACGFQNDGRFWNSVMFKPRETLLSMEIQASSEIATEERIDAVCDAFAGIVDSKSPFTAQHSLRVRDHTVEIAQAFGLTGKRLTILRRAALLHDIGKLGVSNTILDKPGKPTDREWQTIKLHPYYTQQILIHITGFERITAVAAAHHERLDGNGYFQKLNAKQLDLDMRILAAADVFDALSARRPYRDALPLNEVFAILDKDAGIALDQDCIEALKQLNLGSNQMFSDTLNLGLKHAA